MRCVQARGWCWLFSSIACCLIYQGSILYLNPELAEPTILVRQLALGLPYLHFLFTRVTGRPLCVWLGLWIPVLLLGRQVLYPLRCLFSKAWTSVTHDVLQFFSLGDTLFKGVMHSLTSVLQSLEPVADTWDPSLLFCAEFGASWLLKLPFMVILCRGHQCVPINLYPVRLMVW